MLIEKIIYDSYKEQMGAASARQIEALEEEAQALQKWGERWSPEVKDPGHTWIDIPRFVEHNGDIVEIFLPMCIWPLEMANKHMLGYTDIRVVESFRKVKRIGFQKPSTAVYGYLFEKMHAPDMDELYAGRTQEWSGVQLILRRFHTTARVAYRYDRHEEFGKRIKVMKDGSTDIIYGRAQWREELVRRGIISSGKKS